VRALSLLPSGTLLRQVSASPPRTEVTGLLNVDFGACSICVCV
jgi:hypothetical protein